jgi:hypothetical protein
MPNQLSLPALRSQQAQADTQAYMDRLRMAMFNAITEGDVAEMTKQLVERAKGGDEKSLKMVMDYLIGGTRPNQQTNILVEAEPRRSRKQHKTLPGSSERVDAMAKRRSRGEAIFDEDA